MINHEKLSVSFTINVNYSFVRVDQYFYGQTVLSRLKSIDQSEPFIFTKFPCRQNCQLPLHRGGVTLGAGNCRDVGREGRSFTLCQRVIRDIVLF